MISLKHWTPETFEVSTYKWSINDRKNKSYTTSGSDNSGKCTYTYNSLGFRGDEPTKQGFKVMSVGCSHTEGVGLNDDETWSHQLCKLINGVDLNFGYGGRSNDYVTRCLITYFDIIKPDLVLIMYPNQDRREYYTEDGNIEPFAYNPWGHLVETEDGKEIYNGLMAVANNESNYINWYKNHLLIKYYLKTKQCPWVWNGSHLFAGTSESNRFDGDYRNFIDYGKDGNHSGPLHNKQYATNLHQFLIDNKII
jgi:hypothetical protein